MASIIKADTLQSTTSNVSILNSAGTEYARFDSTGVFQLTNPTTFPAGTAALPSITATGDTNTGIFFPAADTIAFVEGGAEAMRIDSSGRLSIGGTTVTDTHLLNIQGSTVSHNIGVILNKTNSTAQIWGITNTGPLTFYNYTAASEAMRIDTSGNVGIGTSSPARRLHVKAGGVTTLGNSNGALFTDASNAGVLLGSDNVLGYVQGVTVAGTATVDLVLQPFGGSVFVGVTSTPSSGAIGAAFQLGASVAGSQTLTFRTNTTSAYEPAYFYNTNGLVGFIRTSGSATSYSTSSDYRLKNTIAPMTGALAKVALLKPCTYKWNVDGSDGRGFIAHELAEVEPGCVSGEKDAVDADGNPKYQGVDTSFLVATLAAAIQEQQALITQLQADVAALKAK